MGKLKYFTILICLLSCGGWVGPCTGARILFLLPLASKSHTYVMEPLMRALGSRNHEITALTPVLLSNMPPTVRQIQLVKIEELEDLIPNPIKGRQQNVFQQMSNSSTFEKIAEFTEIVLKHPKLHEILQNEKFDLVMVDIVMNLGVIGVIPVLNTSSIFVSALAPPGYIANVVGARLPPSFVPSPFLQRGSDRMSFVDRALNSIVEIVIPFMLNTVVGGMIEAANRKYLPGGDQLPGLDEIQSNVSMIFCNSHFTLNYPRPLLPDVIEVGGMHLRPPNKLPKELDDFVKGSGDNGFILFSLGSIVRAREMPEGTRKMFLNVFSRLKQRVLWKWDGETMPDLPKNVKLSKWIPQQDVLGHPNIKLFMTHGGLLSMQESVYHGVPVLGIPIFGDQDVNVRQAETRGYGKFVEILEITEDSLEETIKELINNPVYAENAKSLSKLVRDLPETPLGKQFTGRSTY